MTQSFTPAWLAADPRAEAFLPLAFRDPAQRLAAVERARSARSARAGGAAGHVDPRVLRAIDKATPNRSAAQQASLDKLASGALAVVTGQQVGLYLGPLYTLYKTASAIAVANKLEAEAGHPIVPVFWLQTEDADFEEVRRTWLPSAAADGDGLVELALSPDEGEASRVSLAHRRLGDEIIALNARLRTALAGPHADAVMALVERHYRPGQTLGAAMGGLVSELFADHGLLVFDPRDASGEAETAALGSAVHRRAIGEARAIEDALSRRAAALEEAGFAVQVPIRRGVALSCFHAEGALGPRHRLAVPQTAGEPWRLPGTERVVADGELAAALELEPTRFSTTALLRPILQDTLLPTVAYVGGPGEVAYWAQLPPLYAHFGLPLPLVVPRARFRLVTATARRLAETLGVAPDAPLGAVRARLAQDRPELAPVEAAMSELGDVLERTLATAGALAESLEDQAFGKQSKKADELIRQTLERLAERLRQKALERDALQLSRLQRLESLLAPRGEPQERVLGFCAFAAQVGATTLVERVLAAVLAQGEPGALIEPTSQDLLL